MPRSSQISPVATDLQPRLPVRYVVLGWLCLAAAVAYAQRFPLGVGASVLQDELDLSDEAMGWAMGAFFITYALFQIPGGRLADRMGSRAALALCVAGCSLATACTGAAAGLASLVIARLAVGAFQACIFPAATASIARWFPAGQRALASGVMTGFMSLGGAGSTALVGWLLAGIDWRQVFVLFSLPGIAWAVGWYYWFRDRPEDHSWTSAAELAQIRAALPRESEPAASAASDPQSQGVPWRVLLTSRAMVLIAVQQFFRAAGYALFVTWFPKFLTKVFDVTLEQAGWLTSIPLMGVVLGSWAGGWFSDWLLVRTGSRGMSRQGTAVVTMFLCAAMFAAAYAQSQPGPAVALIAGAAFMGSVAGPIAYALTIDMGAGHVTTVFSVMNMAGNVGAATFPIVVGRMVGQTGRWEWVSLLVAGIYVAGGLCWLLLDPRGTVFDGPSKT